MSVEPPPGTLVRGIQLEHLHHVAGAVIQHGVAVIAATHVISFVLGGTFGSSVPRIGGGGGERGRLGLVRLD